MRRDVFQAIADPTRRDILQMLAWEPLNVTALAARFDISRPAISRHLKILVECGVVIVHVLGRERYCEANLRPLAEVAQWVERYRPFWSGKLDTLQAYLEQTPPRRSGPARGKVRTRNHKP